MKSLVKRFKILVMLFFMTIGSLFAQRPSAEDMVKREKQNIYSQVEDITPAQKKLLEEIYTEYAATFKEKMDEIRRTRNYSKYRSTMSSLRQEKDGILADVFNDEQFEVYRLATVGKAGAKEDTTQYRTNEKWIVTGVLADGDDGTEIIGATVKLINIRDSTKSKYAITDIQGRFIVRDAEDAFYDMTVTSMGYKPYNKVFRVGVVDLNLGRIFVRQDAKVLDAIEVKGDVVAMEKKGDTIQYNADAFKVNSDASTKDLVSKMPGIVIDGTGVSANGETVQQVLLDGKRFFGQDPLLSLNTIPAEVVKNVQVFDQKSEQAQFTGVDDGNTTRTMNVVTKEGKKNGKFGKFYGGYGTNDRYSAGFNLNSFNKDRRITLIGMSNNVNIQNFSSEDLAGVGGGGGRRGGFRGGGSGGSFLTGTQSGITNTNAVGLNYSDKLSKKTQLESSYFFNQTDNTNNEETSRQFANTGTDYYAANNRSNADNKNHRMNMRITHEINDKNRLVVRPSFSHQDNIGIDYSEAVTRDENGEIIRETENDYLSLNKSYNFSNELDYIHKFNKIGRTFSLEVENRHQTTDRQNFQEELITEFGRDSLTNYEYYTKEISNSVGVEMTYSEPVGNNNQISAEYRIDYSDRSSDKKAYVSEDETDDLNFFPELSNEFESNYTTHQSTVEYTNRSFGNYWRVQLTHQHAILTNDQFFPETGNFQRKFNNILPAARGRINVKGGGSMFFSYSARTNEPSVGQLQNVVDRSNSLLWSIGNPELKQSYTHSLFWRYSKSNIDNNTSFSNFSRMETTYNYVTNQIRFASDGFVFNDDIEVPRGTQISQPVNLNGYWNLNNSTTYSKLISKIKTNMSTTIGLTYRRQPGFNNEMRNIASTYSGSGRVNFASNISKDVDFNIYYNASTNTVVNSIVSGRNSNNHYITQTVGGKINLTFWKGVVFRSDIFYQKYDGVNDEFNTTYTLWNMSLAKKFLKNNLGELEVSVFDLLKQNRSITQSVSPTYLQETRTQVLQQYFMLKFTYQLRKFKASASSQGGGQGGGPGRGQGGRPGGGPRGGDRQ
ncbi:MAG: outer membrane beta-barrel protein [Cyclobacteriaceae bacterium]